MSKLIMWNPQTLNGFFEGAKKWDLDFHPSPSGNAQLHKRITVQKPSIGPFIRNSPNSVTALHRPPSTILQMERWVAHAVNIFRRFLPLLHRF